MDLALIIFVAIAMILSFWLGTRAVAVDPNNCSYTNWLLKEHIMPSIADLQAAVDGVAASTTTIVNDVHLLVTKILNTPGVPQELVDQATALKAQLDSAHGEAVTAEEPA